MLLIKGEGALSREGHKDPGGGFRFLLHFVRLTSFTSPRPHEGECISYIINTY